MNNCFGLGSILYPNCPHHFGTPLENDFSQSCVLYVNCLLSDFNIQHIPARMKCISQNSCSKISLSSKESIKEERPKKKKKEKKKMT